jgi:hypothetical protein
MTRLTVDIDSSRSEKVVLAVLQALGLSYELESVGVTDGNDRPLNKVELAMYKRLKKSFEDIKLHSEGKLELKTIEEVLAELS